MPDAGRQKAMTTSKVYECHGRKNEIVIRTFLKIHATGSAGAKKHRTKPATNSERPHKNIQMLHEFRKNHFDKLHKDFLYNTFFFQKNKSALQNNGITYFFILAVLW